MKIKVSAVSYLNTLPFLYGINNTKLINQIDLSIDMPSICADKLIAGEVDLGLIPVAVIPKLKNSHIVSDFCLGANKKVNTVLLLSDVPLNEIKTVLLDYQSRTSVNLVKVLAKEFWKITPKWVNTEKGFEKKIKNNVAGVVIGDRTFSIKNNYKYAFDLAEQWYINTKLPFVFAAWVANKPLPNSFINDFNKALNFGVENINQVVNAYSSKQISKDRLLYYLTEEMSYTYTQEKQKALSLFFDYLVKHSI